ncbi:MAG: dynamin family protein [Waterburya sp.]
MNQPENKWQNLVYRLKTLIAILELEPESELALDALLLIDFLSKTTFQIAVFAPFNYGKSTLLNALLGQKALPIDLIPSTGAAITIKYGTEVSTKIIFRDGTETIAANTKILQEYAILDSERRMRNDLQAVEVTCNYPLLKQGVELLDLPGTNDREAQDNLVKDKLLTADLILQVLDARKLMTLLERENLRDWLQARGIKTVIFVVNFLNSLELEDQKKVYNRLKFVAESFRSDLPEGISNLYRVDALPALRARIKGDYNTVMETGLINLETALQSIVKVRSEQPETKLARVKAITEKLILVAGEKRTKIENQLEITRQKQQQQIAIKNKAATLIKQGLQHSISEFENWLDLSHLLKIEQAKLAIAIETNDFKNWQVEFNKIVSNYQQSVTEWLSKSRDFFDVELSLELAINFPEPPYIETAKTETNNDTSELSAIEEIEKRFNQTVKAFLAINKRELFNNLADKIPFESESKPQKSLYAEAAEVYLTSFSKKALISLKEYQERAEKLIKEQPQPTQPTINREEYQLQLLDSAIENLRSSKLNSFKL